MKVIRYKRNWIDDSSGALGNRHATCLYVPKFKVGFIFGREFPLRSYEEDSDLGREAFYVERAIHEGVSKTGSCGVTLYEVYEAEFPDIRIMELIEKEIKRKDLGAIVSQEVDSLNGLFDLEKKKGKIKA